MRPKVYRRTSTWTWSCPCSPWVQRKIYLTHAEAVTEAHRHAATVLHWFCAAALAARGEGS